MRFVDSTVFEYHDHSMPTAGKKLKEQTDYAKLLLRIGNGSTVNDELSQVLSYDEVTRTSRIRLPNVKTFISTGTDTLDKKTRRDILEWLYPSGFNPAKMSKVTIIAGLNVDVDSWNNQIQSMNPNKPVHLISRDELAEVDDRKGVLRGMLSTDVLHRFQDPKTPPHELYIAVGDICYLYRTLAKKEG